MARITSRSGGAGRGRAAGGFSLLEVMVAIILVGVGLATLMVAARSDTQANAAGRDVTKAALLAQAIREWTSLLPFSDRDPGDQGNPPGPDGSSPQVFVDDLDDLIDVTYSPPRDAFGQPIAGAQGWSQRISLEWKNPDLLTAKVADGSSDVIQVTVNVAYGGRNVLTTNWLVTRKSSS